MKIGILGGSFNPIHNGHLSIATRALDFADEVWLMPCKNHPLDKKVESVNARADMINLSIRRLERIRLSDFELRKEGTSYTYQTLRGLKQEFPEQDFYWIIGSDILHQLAEWHGYEVLQKEAKFIVFHREKYPLINAGINISRTFELEHDNISSTEVRRKVKQGKSISDLVPKAVEEYIQERGLYR